ncbi:DUF1840 domain-containing protein [Vibrio sp. J1-1]|uniref:DUF1840 domain-containing protein n=1 Tax=Vibrio sp. J1-1 TaxID=2912251 RepID=UPI001DC76B01|nr:DUF1840 domain-containing protein [Vibrio sp. J1-1]MBR9786478.1 DUF1840 domain-containing protein [Vibrionaceae bacterium]MBR9872771.1 DUF1840 domain-containing protein [Vibrionaceae bacterium]MCF7480900.1 DUF1840 domain-containing protein [Vibrio sp. J1-1]
MLITFRCKSHANITMFGDIGLNMIKMMGHSGTVPGAILAQDLPEALAKLTASLTKAAEEEKKAAQEADDDDEQSESVVSIGHRAMPLVELLKSAIDDQCDVMWDSQ